ncbi:hypothetical protein GGI22_001307, partial [Coemansia erecta]
QSTDDWMLLGQSRAYGSPNINDANANADSRLNSLDQLRVAAANRKQFNPLMNDSSVYLF